MATSVIKVTSAKYKTYKFENLTQYNPGPYYFYIGDIKNKVGLPSSARIIQASLNGWGGLSVEPQVNLSEENKILVRYTINHEITDSSYITVLFVYV